MCKNNTYEHQQKVRSGFLQCSVVYLLTTFTVSREVCIGDALISTALKLDVNIKNLIESF